MNKYYSVMLFSCFITACSWISDAPEPVSESTLVDLKPAFIPEKSSELPRASLDQLRELYLQALDASEDPDIRRQIKARLASIEMQRSEEKLVAGSVEKQLFADAIQAYESIVTQYPVSESNDKHMYQLARAYDLNGEPKKSIAILSSLVGEHSDSDRYIESQFRLAESYFGVGQYSKAVQHYGNVIGKGESSYYQNALYMLAWSKFKVANYDDAITTFVAVIDLLLQGNNNIESLARANKEIINDSFRMLSVSFSTLEGYKSLSQMLNELGERDYSALLYQSLAEYYLSLERFKDSADTYKAFIQRYPLADEAYQFQIAEINVYKKGGFRQEVLEGKKDFVTAYSVRSDYWKSRNKQEREKLNVYLKDYIVELASYFHTLAQENSNSKSLQISANKSKINKKLENKNKAQSIAYYQQAASYYNLFVESFPDDNRVAEMLFLLAESQFEAGGYRQAISSYERVAYQYSHHKKAVEAGYAAILAYDKLDVGSSKDKLLESDDAQKLTREKVASSLRFAKTFPQDSRAMTVQLTAAQSLLDLKDYGGAITAAEELTQWQNSYQLQADNTLILSAWLVLAQSAFDSNDYFYAESAYGQALQMMPATDKRRVDISENFAASIYQQGAIAVAASNYKLAAEHFSRVISDAPSSSIRVTAQYDAANSFFKVKEWGKAIDLLTDFRRRFPNNSFTESIAASLALAYQELQQWPLAAKELAAVYKRESNPEKKGQLLFLTAELYEKSNDIDQAIIYYRDYAHNYRQPLAINIEAMQKMNELYTQIKELDKQRFWLRKIIETDAGAGSDRSDRTRYLAAAASSVFADESYQTFKNIKITLPIKKPLKRKKKALAAVIKRYQAINAYGISEFSTLSSYRLAEVYGQLSRDLINSERPDKLDELALEQYEVLLEEQAYPFEEKAIVIHEKNIQNSWNGIYDHWVKQSFEALAILLPARYNKKEKVLILSEDIN